MTTSIQQIIDGIHPINQAAVAKAMERTAQLVMPPRALGRLHEIGERLCGIQGTLTPAIRRKAVLVMAGDHGVVAEGISAFPQEVTGAMIRTFLAGGAGINAIARHVGADVWVADMGILPDLDAASLKNGDRLLVRKVGHGTRNFARGPAMTLEEAHKAVLTGFELASSLIRKGVDLLGTGDMGIGNTTPSAAIGAAVTGKSLDEMVGRGTGIDDAGLSRKREVIRRGLDLNRPDPRDGLDLLSKVGGFEIGGIAGIVLAGRPSPQTGRRRRLHLDGRGPDRPDHLPARHRLRVCRALLGRARPSPHAGLFEADADPQPGHATGRRNGRCARHERHRGGYQGDDRGDDV